MMNNLSATQFSAIPRVGLKPKTTQLSTAPTMAPSQQTIENGAEQMQKSMDGSATNNQAAQNVNIPKPLPSTVQLATDAANKSDDNIKAVQNKNHLPQDQGRRRSANPASQQSEPQRPPNQGRRRSADPASQPGEASEVNNRDLRNPTINGNNEWEQPNNPFSGGRTIMNPGG